MYLTHYTSTLMLDQCVRHLNIQRQLNAHTNRHFTPRSTDSTQFQFTILNLLAHQIRSTKELGSCLTPFTMMHFMYLRTCIYSMYGGGSGDFFKYLSFKFFFVCVFISQKNISNLILSSYLQVHRVVAQSSSLQSRNIACLRTLVSLQWQ